jgi:3-methyladenine DNA glycosylase Mpg
VVEDTPGDTVTITATGALIYGRVLEGEVDDGEDANGSSGATGQTSFVITAAANRGDSFRLVCDGTYWYAQGVSALDGSFTVA